MIVYASGVILGAIDGVLAVGSAPAMSNPLTAAQIGATAGVASLMTILLAAVFLIAAATKLRSTTDTAAAFADLGLPLARPLAVAAPVVEAAVAVLLLVRPDVGGTAALVLLTGLTAILWQNLRSGRSVRCGCFGSLADAAVTTATLARNLCFVSMATMAMTVESLVWPDVPSALIAVSVVLLGAIAVQAVSLRTTIGRIWSVELAGEGRIGEKRLIEKTLPKGTTV